MLKQLFYFAVLTAMLSSCERYVVKSIEINASNQNIVYKDKGGNLLTDKAVAREGDKIKITVDNYNPLVETVSINPIQTNYFYQQSSPLLANFFSINNSTTSPTETEANKKRISDSSIGLLNINPCADANNPLWEIIQSLNGYKSEVKNTYQNFKCFYNQLVYLEAEFNELKLNKSINKNCICRYLKDFKSQIIPLTQVYSINKVDDKCAYPSERCPEETDECSDSVLSAVTLLNANIKYKQYFLEVVDSLTQLKLKMNAAAEKVNLSKYKDCQKEIVNENKDIESQISFYQTLNKDYNDKFDKSITDAINDYSKMRHLSYTYVQNNIAVENTDEFKANVVIANSTKPETRTITVNLLVTKAVKIDFSAGAFYSPLYNETYELKKVSGVDSFSLHTLNASNFTLGPMGYINFHTQTRDYVNVGLFLGSGLAFNQNAKLVIAGGGSFLFGKYQRVILHGGVAFAQVDRVSSLYGAGEYFADATYKPAIISPWKSSFLVGISWNMSRN